MMTKRPDFREHLNNSEMTAANELADEDERTRWQGLTALILAVLSIYFILVPILNVVLALLAVIFGVWGLHSREKVGSVAGVVIGMVNIALVLVTCLVMAVVWRWMGSMSEPDGYEFYWSQPSVSRQVVPSQHGCGQARERIRGFSGR